jgi:RNA polymerase sigma factor (sigma-70 family)
MFSSNDTDKDVKVETLKIIADLSSGNDLRIKQIYQEFFPPVRNLVLNNHGNLEDAEDVYQDCLVIIFRKIRNAELQIHCSFSTYIYSIARNLWLQRLKARQVHYRNEGALSEPEDPWPRDAWILEEKMKIFREHYNKMKPDCRKVIRMMTEKKSMEEIAQKMGYRNTTYVKTKKFNCKELLRRRIMEDPRYKSLFE